MPWKEDLQRVMNQLKSEYKQSLDDLKKDVRTVCNEIVKKDKDKDDSIST